MTENGLFRTAVALGRFSPDCLSTYPVIKKRFDAFEMTSSRNIFNSWAPPFVFDLPLFYEFFETFDLRLNDVFEATTNKY